MDLKTKKQIWNTFKWLALVLALIPILVTVFQLFTTESTAIIFLDGFHPLAASFFEIYYVVLILGIVIWGILQVKSILKLKNEKTKNELMHLQSQVSPHFFFNMLNNLYGLVDQDSESAKELILKLSDLMRYSIYEGEKDTVSIMEEVAYLNNYIALHKMRYHKEIDVQFNTSLDNKTLQVKPLLYIILVENAFKHGVENLRNGAYVHCDLRTKENSVSFVIENNFDTAELPELPGIGIKNLRRRLELVYPNRHKLTFKKQDSIFRANLEIDI